MHGRISKRQFELLAERHDFMLSEAQIDILYERLLDLLDGFEQFDQMRIPEERPFNTAARRTPMGRPTVEDDPYCHFISRCSVTAGAEGPLTGKRVILKDHIAVAGIPMTLGYRFMDGYVPDFDATIVDRLLAAGAEIVGKANMDHNSYGGSGWGGYGDFGPPRNPLNPEYLTGGSSSGSAGAVATGSADIGFAGDQAGSTRLPASWCGLVGLKATAGLIPHTGVIGMDPTIDSCGPITRTVHDMAEVLDCVAGWDGLSPLETLDPRQLGMPAELPNYVSALELGAADLRIGVLSEGVGFEGSEADVEENFQQAVEILGGIAGSVADTSVPLHSWGSLAEAPILCQGVKMMFDTNLIPPFHGGFYPESFMSAIGRAKASNAHELSPNVQLHMIAGQLLQDRYQGRLYAKAQNVRRTFNAAYDSAFRDVDVLVMPTCPFGPVKWREFDGYTDAYDMTLFGGQNAIDLVLLSRNTAPFSYTGHPAISVPCGHDKNGMPLGLQIVGPRYRDDLVLRVAHAFEAAMRSAGGS